MNLVQRIAHRFSIGGYDAAKQDGNQRKPGPTRIGSEDQSLDARQRELVSANTRDILRQYSLVGFAVRRHLDAIVDFGFKAQTTDAGFNRDLEAWWADVSKPFNSDVAGRHSFGRALRTAESCRVLDGDVFALKIRSGPNRGKLQWIEADRIFMPSGEIPKGDSPDDWVNGVKLDRRTGKVIAYAISNRVGRGCKKLDRIVSARSIIPLQYLDYRFDQVRGVSRLACAINTLKDIYALQTLKVVKAKLGALMGVAIMRETGGVDGATFGTATDNGDGQPPIVDLQQLGPFTLELNPGEKAEILESRTPSQQTMQFMSALVDATLLALDLPPTFLDPARTNYSGAKFALLAYLLSCDEKIRDLQAFQNEFVRWRLGIDIEDGVISLPRGMTFDDVKFEFIEGNFLPFKAVDETRNTAMEIAMGLQSPRRAARAIGKDYETIIRETADDVAFAESLGVPLTFADSAAFNPQITVGATND
jgi:capsid protein